MPYFNSLRLRQLRHLKRLSLADVSRITGITKAQLSLIENGKADPRISTVVRILGCYGYALADLEPSRPERRTIAEVRSAAERGAARLKAAGLGPSDPLARLDRKDRLQEDTSVEREAIATQA
ncbi:MAG: helix-turn-helix domain-containing protein [Acidimicrobiia bacterium]